MSDARAIMDALEGAVGSADENLKNLQGLTGRWATAAPRSSTRWSRASAISKSCSARWRCSRKNINESEGTLGLLIRDRQPTTSSSDARRSARRRSATCGGHQQSRSSCRRIEQILDNVWVLTDKLARDPARVVRGVVDRETPIK